MSRQAPDHRGRVEVEGESILSRETALTQFKKKHGLDNLALDDLNLALRHRSYAFEHKELEDNERLEFLGDAIIDAVTSDYLYRMDESADEGSLSKWRSRLVSRTSLGRCAKAMNMGPILLLGKGEADTGGMHRLSTLGSALEAIVGIHYLRNGYQAAHDFTCEYIVKPLVGDQRLESTADFKSELQEWTQHRYKRVPEYRIVMERGPAHEREFEVEVSINQNVLGRGRGQRVKSAENTAARAAIDHLQTIGEWTVKE
jgi:ribonuclease-3